MQKNQVFIDKKTGLVIGGGAVLATTALIAPANAQTTPVEDVENTVTSVGTIAATSAGIIVVSLGVRLAVKQVNRVMTKG